MGLGASQSSSPHLKDRILINCCNRRPCVSKKPVQAYLFKLFQTFIFQDWWTIMVYAWKILCTLDPNRLFYPLVKLLLYCVTDIQRRLVCLYSNTSVRDSQSPGLKYHYEKSIFCFRIKQFTVFRIWVIFFKHSYPDMVSKFYSSFYIHNRTEINIRKS